MSEGLHGWHSPSSTVTGKKQEMRESMGFLGSTESKRMKENEVVILL